MWDNSKELTAIDLQDVGRRADQFSEAGTPPPSSSNDTSLSIFPGRRNAPGYRAELRRGPSRDRDPLHHRRPLLLTLTAALRQNRLGQSFKREILAYRMLIVARARGSADAACASRWIRELVMRPAMMEGARSSLVVRLLRPCRPTVNELPSLSGQCAKSCWPKGSVPRK